MSTEMTAPKWPVAADAGAKRSILAENLEIEGDISAIGPVDILGKVTGTVQAPEVLIAASGQLVGKVTAVGLTVLGGLDGSIAAKSVTLAGSARVKADITHEKITIESGALLEGSLKRRI